MKNWVTIVLISLLVSCSGKKEVESFNLNYEMMTTRIESSGGCPNEGVPCASFEVIYPVFENLKPEIAAKFSERINNAVAYDNPEASDFSIKQMGEQFVHDFEKYQQDFPDNTMGWFFKTSFTVQLLVDTLMSVSANSEFFTGGAHGGYTVYYVNINPSTGDEIKLQSVLKPGFEKTLNEEGEKSFRLVRGLSAGDELAEKGFEFPDGKFQLNTNYGFKKEGIVFFFNSYEIAPYALGPTEVLIPWEVLADWRN